MTVIDVKYIDTTPVTCTISYDDFLDSPREWDNLGNMVLSHGRYDLPNELNINFKDFGGWSEIESILTKEHNCSIVLPVQGYDHGALNIYIGNEHDKWDGGQLGFICATDEDVRKWYGVKRITKEVREYATRQLGYEVEDYNKYVNGLVYHYTLEDNRGNYIDSCGGYFDIQDIKQDLNMYNNITYTEVY